VCSSIATLCESELIRWGYKPSKASISLPICTRGRTRTGTNITVQGIFLPTITFVTNFRCLGSGLYLNHFTGSSRQVSTRSLSGFARYWHFTAFTEFERFYF